MAGKKIEYNEISSAVVTEKRKIVISTCNKGGFTVAQRFDTEEDGKTTSLYLKGAFHINDIDGLYNLRDAVNLAISKVESGELESDEDWDD